MAGNGVVLEWRSIVADHHSYARCIVAAAVVDVVGGTHRQRSVLDYGIAEQGRDCDGPGGPGAVR